MFNIFIFPAEISVNIIVKFINGIIEYKGVVSNSTINTIKLGKNDINVNGVNALCASLNVLDVLAIEILNPLINIEYAIITTTANTKLIGVYIIFMPS